MVNDARHRILVDGQRRVTIGILGHGSSQKMNIIGTILWVIMTWIAISLVWHIRKMVKRGTGVMIQTANIALLLVIELGMAHLLGINSLHFLWMLPVTFIIGQMTILFPFSLISPMGNIFISVCCLGLDRQTVKQNTDRWQCYRQLVIDGYSTDEAEALAKERFPIGAVTNKST